MNETLIRDIERNFQIKSTDQLLVIWQAENREQYSDEAFEAVRRILGSRGHSFPPRLPLKKRVRRKNLSRPRAFAEAILTILGLAIMGAPILFLFVLMRGCIHEDSVRHAVLQAIPICQKMGEREIAVSGKVMLLDDDSTAQHQFPFFTSRSQAILGDLVASPQGSDRNITVFIIRTRRLALVGNYAPGGGRAYSAQFDIYAVQLPKVEPLGMHTIKSPPSLEVFSRGRGTLGDVIGTFDDVLFWIKSLQQKK